MQWMPNLSSPPQYWGGEICRCWLKRQECLFRTLSGHSLFFLYLPAALSSDHQVDGMWVKTARKLVTAGPVFYIYRKQGGFRKDPDGLGDPLARFRARFLPYNPNRQSYPWSVSSQRQTAHYLEELTLSLKSSHVPWIASASAFSEWRTIRTGTFPHTPDLLVTLGCVLSHPTSATQGGDGILDSWKATGCGLFISGIHKLGSWCLHLLCGHSPQSLLVCKGKAVSLSVFLFVCSLAWEIKIKPSFFSWILTHFPFPFPHHAFILSFSDHHSVSLFGGILPFLLVFHSPCLFPLLCTCLFPRTTFRITYPAGLDGMCAMFLE